MLFRFLMSLALIQASFTCDDHIEQRRAPVKLPSVSSSLLEKLQAPINPYYPYNYYNPYNDAESRFLNPLSLLSPSFNPLSFLLDSAACVTSSGLSGICVSGAQCSLFGGSSSGSCGFGGVCCINTVTKCGSTITRNNTYWQSPTTVDLTQPCTLTIHLDSNSLDQKKAPICQVRLDMQSFSIAQPDQTGTNIGVCTTENFQVTGTSNKVPTICGDNDAQHMYLTAPSSTSDLTLTFNFDSTVTTVTRTWNIKVSLLPCSASYLAPQDCLQYFTGSNTGTVKSFNFKSVAPAAGAVRQLGNQDYGICIRKEKGKCGVCYSECTPVANSFGISGDATALNSAAGTTDCVADYLIIAGGYDPTTPANVNDRFCGSALNALAAQTVAALVCTNIKPFNLWYHTDATEVATDVANNGFCLSYKQQTC